MGWVTMSERELNRVEILAQVDDGRLTVYNAANMLDLTRRQVFRLLKRYRQDGAAAIQHKARGKPPNNLFLFTRCCMMHGCLLSCASEKPSTTDQVLNGVYGSGNRGEMGLFHKRGLMEHPSYKNIDKFEHDFHSQSQRLAPVYRAD